MDKYGWLTKRKQKALKVFQAAQADLKRVVAAIEQELVQVHTRISMHQASIQHEQAAVEFLNLERTATEKQTAKIAAILE